MATLKVEAMHLEAGERSGRWRSAKGFAALSAMRDVWKQVNIQQTWDVFVARTVYRS